MLQFTVDQIRSVRNNYREPPYPGFCLEEIVRRRRTGQTKLVRGENAWVAKGAADSEKEWVQRLVQSTLNKLTTKNNDVMLEKLCVREIFHKSEITDMVVDMIFKKALDEPENAKLYAGVCFSLAMYEASVVNEIEKGKQLQSDLRDAVIRSTQEQFNMARREQPNTEGMCEEEAEMLCLNKMRRQRSNMTFVGELYLCTVLSNRTMFEILTTTIHPQGDNKYPTNGSIELFVALLTTVGERMDAAHKKELDGYFKTLTGFLKKADCPYPHRIRFKIMDLLDLRKNGWGAKAKVAKPPAAAATHGKEKKGATTASSPPAAAKRGGGRDGTAAFSTGDPKSWRDTGSNAKSSGSPRAVSPAGSGLGLQNRGTGASSSGAAAYAAAATNAGAADEAAFRGTPAPEVPLVKFELRVAAMFQEWVSERSNDMILHWVEQFNTCDRVFESESELCVAVALEVIKSACLTTRKDAQREAFSFLVVGLFMIDTEVFDGFAGALATAIEDGLLEDTPKFGERFMNMLRLTSTEQETRADVYFDAANVLRLTYNRLEEADDFAVDTLMTFWDRVPHVSTDEENMIRMELDVLYNVCNPEGAQPGLERLLSRIIRSMLELELMEPGVMDEFLSLELEDGLCAKVIADYKQRFQK
ncbi:putative eukaryotic translation initiation factor 4 gamma [Leptomonas pyrrhocoris]|uniref:Putative eukaryotic translation initiation factor 4 gamma n=1 Tax=Leptomonas pyrrhocoris TaxID=157538 RepID=A0A0N0VEI4_LEPPY|nr:putative eukaryotic translation initiation factor 4 gamma [Leptomonas pyrrhocoris]XP_015656521.1 putative eukaryotic translation initiation factor 4 gamma [Leptomonas pyrrhocoris]KPA78081.1 putative eukaryotic translation initiation factor 4 gamma [Leptomonas pyrrhocoris]KPA78082.1 putative eukaryotic translation initiation factor 4 gamma [Leptomonas pyrrhocoris]|eukprot:XP_015656520.1 putative eukaryotic translation initiation factor 4 gamma [Leptomonas pyrrhocoris]